jgi:hypothetical protein
MNYTLCICTGVCVCIGTLNKNLPAVYCLHIHHYQSHESVTSVADCVVSHVL